MRAYMINGKRLVPHGTSLFPMVEMRGVEPLSESA